MLTILTTIDRKDSILKAVQSVDRLEELLVVTTDKEQCVFSSKLLVMAEDIQASLDWLDTEPPYVVPPVGFTESNALALIFFKLGNHQKAFEYVKPASELHDHLLIATNLQFGYPMTQDQLDFLDETSKHNLAIVYNFGNIEPEITAQDIQDAYVDALKSMSSNSEKLFTVKHYANLLMDRGMNKDAEKLLQSVMPMVSGDTESIVLDNLLSEVMRLQLNYPYDQGQLHVILEKQERGITFFEKVGLKLNAGLLLVQASEIAGFLEDFVKSKDLVNKAILYFREENVSQFLGNATMQKAALLYAWSKNGSPQYYKPAINTYQNALKVFKRDEFPEQYAEIQHNLALIYSEIQVSENEKPIWTAFCASAFKEALAFYTKTEYPYQFAMVSNNYATALMGFPEAKLHNNLDKSFALFEQALEIRSAEKYPYERALTLLNQLELYWMMHNASEQEEEKNFEMMVGKAKEVCAIVEDEELIKKAQIHLEALEKLKSII